VRHIENLANLSRQGLFFYKGRAGAADATFVSGECAMYTGSSAAYGNIKRNAKFASGISTLPYYPDVPGSPQNTVIGGASLWVMAGKNPVEYKGVGAFFDYLSRADVQAKSHQTTGYLPITLAAFEMTDKSGFYAKNPGSDVAVNQMIRKTTDKPIRYVFDTHHHGDHDYGSAVWTEAGATTFAYKGVAEELARYEPNRWQDTAKTRKDVGELNRTAPEMPKETFDKSPYILKDSTREIRFYHLGWAHTRGDGFAWLPKERILASGDAGVNGAFNYTADANIGNWPKVMEAALKLNPLHVMPGHGGPGGPEILKGQAAFMTDLVKAVSAEVKAGKKLEELVTMKNGSPTATSITLPAEVKNWVGGSLPTQVADAYREISQKQPNGAIPHK